MTAIPRLLHSSKNLATRRLLTAGLRDRAPERTAAALTAALGLELAASSAAASTASALAAISRGSVSASAAPSLAAGVAGGGLPAASGALPSALGLAKWLLVGACAGGLGSAGYWASEELRPEVWKASGESAEVALPAERAPRRGSRAEVPGLRVPPSEVELPSAAVPAETPGASARVAVSSAARSGAVAPLASPEASPVEAVATPTPDTQAERNSALERETRLVDSARRALLERDLARASALLDTYDATRLVRVLDREALLLRVELLLLRGEPSAARALAERFARSYPSDAHSVRLRSLLSAAAGAPPR